MRTQPVSGIRDAAALLGERLASIRSTPAYQAYERVRGEVERMKSAERGPDGRPSAYWQEELENMEYLLDASPLTIEKLRHHTLHVTGIRPYDYRTGAEEKRQLLAEKLELLRELGGDELLVPEPSFLGGFGHEIDGQLYNIDTLKFYEAVIALDRGGLLGPLRASQERRVVILEIGPGWGGFAYQLKTLVPNACFVLVDLPELFLFSAVYLLTAFPDASVAFWEDAEPLDPSSLSGYDFVFVPHTSFANVELAQLDLGINMVSFQEMSTAQVRAYAERLDELGCPFVYSLNRDRSGYNTELSSVREILAERFWLQEVPILPVAYTTLGTREAIEEAHQRARRKNSKSVNRYRHVIGKRRARADSHAAA